MERECAKIIQEVSQTAAAPLGKEPRPNHARYLELYKKIHNFDKRLGRRYDGISGSQYLLTVSSLLVEGILKDEDLDICDETMREELIRAKIILMM